MISNAHFAGRKLGKISDLNNFIYQGKQLALSECKYQFKNRKWNCPTNKKYLKKLLKLGLFSTVFDS